MPIRRVLNWDLETNADEKGRNCGRDVVGMTSKPKSVVLWLQLRLLSATAI